MRIGFCTTDTAYIPTLLEMGFDYIEVSNTAVAAMSDAELAALLNLKNTYREGVFYAANGLIPGEYRLGGEGVSFGDIRLFCHHSFARLHALGVKVLVFGSGKAKHVPDGFPVERAMSQLTEILRIMAEEAAPYGMWVCVEPLSRTECNIIHTVADGIALAHRVGVPNLKGHVDHYHFFQNGESLADLKSMAGELIHAHIAEPTARLCPTRGDGADYAAFFDALRTGGYDKTLSVECKWKGDMTILPDALSYLKSL